ncbi:hypothetical protein [Phenylobacterium sp.]|uniref:hypothetical protein n=1 Tax=Phenylobacterium sp. TaxID=1871053 RepID=UPI002732C5D6|nr:hypothetical protein [Phenylobacterium sp.]MDP3854577.1 hypothetical protein [Phenylobacterium sp.]
MALVCGFAFWRGRRPEWIAAGACILAWALTPLAQNSRNWFDPQWGVFAVDLALLMVLAWLALTTDRTWLLFASAFQLLAVIIHLAILVDPSVTPMPYRQGLVIWSYLVIASLGVGVWLEWRRTLADPPSD